MLIPLWVYLSMRFVYFSLQFSIIFFCSADLMFGFDLLWVISFLIMSIWYSTCFLILFQLIPSLRRFSSMAC